MNTSTSSSPPCHRRTTVPGTSPMQNDMPQLSLVEAFAAGSPSFSLPDWNPTTAFANGGNQQPRSLTDILDEAIAISPDSEPEQQQRDDPLFLLDASANHHHQEPTTSVPTRRGAARNPMMAATTSLLLPPRQ